MKNQNFWLTHFEKSGKTESPNYENTIKYFQKFQDKTQFVKIKTIGYSHQQREIKVVIVSKDKIFNPIEAKRKNKAIILIQNCIHAGEVEGKDASMLMLREMLITKEKENLLNNVVLLIIPVINVDGHERRSPFNRPNQNGPKQMGWRTNALNLNLNRDYLKAESNEIKAFLNLFNQWLPDFFIDNHTTNGADYQYHITYAVPTHQNLDKDLVSFVKNKFLPYMIPKVEEDGFIVGPYMEFKQGTVESGILDLAAPPRLSHGYCAAQNRIGLLIETHSLKPFENRVYSTKSMMEHTIEFVSKNYLEIISLNKQADFNPTKIFIIEKKKFPLVLISNGEYEIYKFKGFEWYEEYSSIMGVTVRKYTQKPIEVEVPIFNKCKSKVKIVLPEAYLIPIEYQFVADKLRLHNVKIFRCSSNITLEVERYKFYDVSFASKPYEGRQQPNFKVEMFKEKVQINKNYFVVPTNQRTLRIIVHLLEPESVDSLVSWGFFNHIFERKEYAEAYIMEPIAQQMLKNDPELRNEFKKKCEDESFCKNPFERLDFFYKRSPFFDKNENVYPILRANNLKDKLKLISY
ncbi:MAG: M14 family metallopeptidase [Ignavibacterium sp.]|nr:M14 family metallopeptidase [Ignavibacterium sp.]MDW8375383.1 M14 family metallopeptidase [Ignavibacteriales bacterium]